MKISGNSLALVLCLALLVGVISLGVAYKQGQLHPNATQLPLPSFTPPASNVKSASELGSRDDGPGPGFDGGEHSGDEAVVASSPPADITSLSGIYSITLAPNDSKHHTERYRLVLSIKPPSGSSISFDMSIMDSSGDSRSAQAGYAHFNTASGSMEFVASFTNIFDVYELHGTISSNGLNGNYTKTVDTSGFSGDPLKYSGTLNGQKIF